jgi:hypothetical protein
MLDPEGALDPRYAAAMGVKLPDPCEVCGRPTGGCCTVAVPPMGAPVTTMPPVIPNPYSLVKGGAELARKHRQELVEMGWLEPDTAPPANSPCPRCAAPVTVARCTSSFSRWCGGWEVVCEPCHVAYTGADTEEHAMKKARDLDRYYP